jgi:hypothetical protein
VVTYQSPSGTPSDNCHELCRTRRMRTVSPTMRYATIYGVRVMTNSRGPSTRPGRSLLGSQPGRWTRSLIRVPTGPWRVDCLPRWCRRARRSPLAPTGTIRASGVIFASCEALPSAAWRNGPPRGCAVRLDESPLGLVAPSPGTRRRGQLGRSPGETGAPPRWRSAYCGSVVNGADRQAAQMRLGSYRVGQIGLVEAE